MRKVLSILLILLVLVPATLAFQGSKLDVKSVEVLELEDDELTLAITIHNKNSIDARDIRITLYLDNQRHFLEFPDLNTGEKDKVLFVLPVECKGEVDLRMVVENDDTRFEWAKTLDLPESEVSEEESIDEESSREARDEYYDSVPLWSSIVNFLLGA
jgi:hypothetical protein